MRKFLNFCLIAFGILLSLLLLAGIVLRLMFPPEKLKKLVEDAIHQRLNREAKIENVHLGLSGVTMERLELSEIPNLKAGTFLNAEGVRLEWSLRKLWEGFSLRRLFPSELEGKLSIAHAHNPYYDARDFSLAWSLTDLDPSWGHLSGWARLRQGPGMIQNIEKLVASEKNAKLVLMPLLLLQNLDKLGFTNLGFPDLSHWPVQSIEGDYGFQHGTMKIGKFRINSQQLELEAKGYVELATGGLGVDIGLHAPQRTLMGEMDLKMHVSGTMSNPKTDLDSLKKKAFRATVKNLLQNPDVGKAIDSNLQKLFH